tara:strand:+ start:194 stop:877 length:684 start_codon:yes stop_codon:yes gene_type:complete
MKEIEEIESQIESEMGISLKNYKSNEIEQTITNMLIFPQYFFKKILFSVLLFLSVFLVSIFLLELTPITFIFYLIIGVVLFFISGVIFGFLRFFYSIESDILSVFNFSVDLISNILNKSKEITKKEDFELLYKGVVMVIVYPIVSNVIKRKIWVLSAFVNRIIYKVFKQICKVKIDVRGLYNIEVLIGEVKAKVNRVLKKIINKISLPLKIVFGFLMSAILILMFVL